MVQWFSGSGIQGLPPPGAEGLEAEGLEAEDLGAWPLEGLAPEGAGAGADGLSWAGGEPF